MKTLFTVWLALCATSAVAQQQVAFDFYGRITNAPDVIDKCSCNDTSIVRRNALKGLSALQQDSLRAILKSSFKATAKTLKETKTLRGQYYELLWRGSATDASQLASDYDSLIVSIVNEPYKSRIRTTSPLFSLDSLLANDLLKLNVSSYAIKSLPTTTICQLKLTKINLENKMLLSHFVSIARYPDNKPYTQLNNRAFKAMLVRAQLKQMLLNSLLAKMRQPLTSVVLNEAYSFHQDFETYRKSDLLFKLLEAPWSKSWLWRYSGSLKFNPLSFTEDSLLFPLSNPLQSSRQDSQVAYFNNYVNYVLAKKKTADKDLNITAYAEDVRLLAKGRSLFQDSTVYKRAVAKNRAASLAQRTIFGVVNDASIPLRQPEMEYVTLLNSQKQPLLAPIKLGAFPVETRLAFTLHNVEKNHALKVSQVRATEVKDQSETQTAIDEGLANLSVVKPGLGGSLNEFVKRVTKPRTSVARFAIPVNDINYGRSGPGLSISSDKSKNARVKSYRSATTDSLFWVEMKKIIRLNVNAILFYYKSYEFINMLQSEDIYENKKILESIHSDFIIKEDIKNFLADRSEAKYQALAKQIIDYYITGLADLAASVAPSIIRDDSLLIAASIIVLKESSIPPRTAKPENNKVPLLSTNHVLTSQSDSTRAYTYVLQDEVGTKVTPFAAYQYRTGKRQWLRFSAGVTYTTRPARNPELSITNGQVTYDDPDTRYRVFLGMNYYPFGVMQQDKRFFGTKKTWYTRINFLFGVSTPKPLDNFYFAPGYDFGPGIKLNAGLHLHGLTKYQVFNNQLIDEAKQYEPLPFVSLGIDPASFVKAFTLLF